MQKLINFRIPFWSCLTLISMLSTSCERNNEISGEIIIDSISSITHNSVLVHIQETHSPVTFSYGIMLAESTDKLQLNKHEVCNWGINILGVKNLQPDRTYYVQAWIMVNNPKNSEELYFYSPPTSFRTKKVEVYIDPRDSQEYPVVFVGNNYWLGSNLNFKTDFGSIEAQSEGVSNKFIGRFYTIAAINSAIPFGWKLPSFEDFLNLLKESEYIKNKGAILSPEPCMYNEMFNSNNLGLGIVFPNVPIETGITDSRAVFYLDNGKIASIDKYGNIEFLNDFTYTYKSIRCVKIK